MKREVTIQEAFTELAAAKIEIESMQQQLVLKDKLLSSKEEKINLQLHIRIRNIVNINLFRFYFSV